MAFPMGFPLEIPPGDGDDTPKRGRGIHSDSWDLASLDPATWPVLKAPSDWFRTVKGR